jgi:hypothetical protein
MTAEQQQQFSKAQQLTEIVEQCVENLRGWSPRHDDTVVQKWFKHFITRACEEAISVSQATLLTEQEWRTIHNALSHFQATTGDITDSEWAADRRIMLQQLMDKIRDNFIAQYDQTTTSDA